MRACLALVGALTLSGCASLIGGNAHYFDCVGGPATLVVYKNDARLLRGVHSYLLKPAPAEGRAKIYQGKRVRFEMDDLRSAATLKVEGRPDVACNVEVIVT